MLEIFAFAALYAIPITLMIMVLSLMVYIATVPVRWLFSRIFGGSGWYDPEPR